MRLATGGVAFFVSDRLAATSLSCIRGTWRDQPEVTLLYGSREIAARVVADYHARGIALLEIGASTAGLSPVSLAAGAPEDPAAGLDGRILPPGTPLGLASAVTGIVTRDRGGHHAIAPIQWLRELLSFHANAHARNGAPAGAEPVIFDSAVDALFLRGLGNLVTPKLKSRLCELGLDLDRPPRPSYPRATWVRILAATVAELFSGDLPEDGYRRLGEQSIEGMSRTPIGLASIAMSKLLGPRRSLLQFHKAWPSVNNFITMKVDELAPNHFHVFLNDAYGHPAYMQGVIQSAMKMAGAKDPQALIMEATARDVRLDVRWAG
ncbi:MAG TPA: DUF2378 family protein [Myxococcaceae bacterium]|nr:DUF2378 family protein [Myxococcaceae bacterium]